MIYRVHEVKYFTTCILMYFTLHICITVLLNTKNYILDING